MASVCEGDHEDHSFILAEPLERKGHQKSPLTHDALSASLSTASELKEIRVREAKIALFRVQNLRQKAADLTS